MPAILQFSGIQFKTSNTDEQDHKELCFFPEDTKCLNLKLSEHLVKGIWKGAVSGCLSQGGYISETLLFSKVHPCQEHHQRNTSGGDEDSNSTQLPYKWLRSLLTIWGVLWEKHVSKRVSKPRAVGARRTCIFINTIRRHFTRLFILSSKLCQESFEWFK